MELAIKTQVPLSSYTTLHIGGVADYVVEVSSVEELKQALTFTKNETDKPALILGGGSNVLIGDEGYKGVVIVMKLLGRVYEMVDEDECLLHLGAGEVLDEVVAEVVAKGLWGIENLSSIPGTVGATPVQNVGAYGVEVSSLITTVTAINITTQKEKIFSHDECHFSYRDSFFKTSEGKNWVITNVTYKVTKKVCPQLQYADVAFLKGEDIITPSMVRGAVVAIRSQKFPDWSKIGTAGSFFKNPIIDAAHFAQLKERYKDIVGYEQENGDVKVSLGWVLDKVCGLKGFCENGVCLYEKQALVLVAEKNTTAESVKNFVKNISQIVFEKTKIKIECEVLFI